MVVYKYTFDGKDHKYIELPKNSRFLKAARQNDNTTIWIQLSNELKKETKKFVILGTGWHFNTDDQEPHLMYRDTFFDGPFVWHVFEELQGEI